MTSYTVYKNMPFRVVLRKNKYYDKVIEKSISENTTETIQLETYSGLTVTYNETTTYITVAAGVFADGTPHAAAETFALIPKGQTVTAHGVTVSGILRADQYFVLGSNDLFYYGGEFFIFSTLDVVDKKYQWCGHFEMS